MCMIRFHMSFFIFFFMAFLIHGFKLEKKKKINSNLDFERNRHLEEKNKYSTLKTSLNIIESMYQTITLVFLSSMVFLLKELRTPSLNYCRHRDWLAVYGFGCLENMHLPGQRHDWFKIYIVVDKDRFTLD